MSTNTDLQTTLQRLDHDFAILQRVLEQISQNLRPRHAQPIHAPTLATAGKWYWVQMPPNTRAWFLQARVQDQANPALKLGFPTTDSQNEDAPQQDYITIPALTNHTETSSPKALWVQSDTANTVIEVEVWV